MSEKTANPTLEKHESPLRPEKLEAFIPFLRRDIVAACLSDEALPESERQNFDELCDLLAAYLHFEFHGYAEKVKDCYTAFDPDVDTKFPNGRQDTAENEEKIYQLFSELAERANFFEVTKDDIEKAFEEVTLIDLNTKVDMDDFDKVLCFARGDIFQELTVKKLFSRKVIEVDVLQRVLLLFKYKGEEYFNSTKKKRKERDQSSFEPGMIYTFFYKDVPKHDLELLFPNVRIGMNLRQKLMFAIPAIGGSIGVLIKVWAPLLFALGLILAAIGLRGWAEDLGLTNFEVNFATISAVAALVIALGGLAFKQWSAFRKKQLQFLKEVSEHLFFRSLASNRSVFSRLIEIGEEEESKEMLLVLFHLVVNPDKQFTKQTLDAHIESWFREKFNESLDFDIDGPIKNLSKIKGPLRYGGEAPLVSVDENGILRTVPIADAKHIIDHLWDNAFQYNNSLVPESV